MNEDVIRNEIEQGVAQVDSTLTVSDLACVFVEESRMLKVGFVAKKQNDEALEVNVSYGE